jgi:hypothetical protein
MNFDYRGTMVSTSKATPVLRTVKKVLHVDSADRDTAIYFTNGEFVVYLPRVYEKVVSIRLMSAEFPSLDYAYTHFYGNTVINGTSYTGYGSNIPTGTFSNDYNVGSNLVSSANYFLIEIDGLNKNDEAAIGANRSQYPDAFFAKIPAFLSQRGDSGGVGNMMIEYNDHSGQENIAHYSPPIGKLDRMRIRTRLHSQQGSTGFLYWTNVKTTNPTSAAIAGANFALTFEIEYLDNGFDDFSSLETRLRDRSN